MKTEEEEAPVPEPARGHDVFVSYSRADREPVVQLTQALASRGKRAWVDLEDIPPSAEWMAEIRAAIESSDGYLVAVSPDVVRLGELIRIGGDEPHRPVDRLQEIHRNAPLLRELAVGPVQPRRELPSRRLEEVE